MRIDNISISDQHGTDAHRVELQVTFTFWVHDSDRTLLKARPQRQAEYWQNKIKQVLLPCLPDTLPTAVRDAYEQVHPLNAKNIKPASDMVTMGFTQWRAPSGELIPIMLEGDVSEEAFNAEGRRVWELGHSST